MLLVGVAFLMGLDWLRSAPTPDALDGVVAADGIAPVTDVAASLRPAPPPLPRLSAVPEVPAQPDGMEVVRGTAGQFADGETAPIAPAPRREEPPAPEPAPPPTPIDTRVAAAPPAVPPAIAPRGEVPDDYVAPAAREARAAAPAPPSAPPAGEIPDTYVAPQVQRETVARGGAAERPLSAGQAAGTPAAAANVVRHPASVVESLSSARAESGARQGASAPPPRAPAPAAGRAEAVVTPVRADDEALVQSALQQYARAYGRLDARAAKAVWPSVDETKLARAFADLESQTFAFDNCDISVSGPTASASCRGRATFAGKVGGTRTESRTWRFDLRRDGEEWKIDTAETRR
jgi:hypothetical protein